MFSDDSESDSDFYSMEDYDEVTCGTSAEMNNIIEERYQFCIWLYRIKKETDKRNNEERKRWEENLVYVDIFTLPSHIKILFGGFLKTPQYTRIANLTGHRTLTLTIHNNKLYASGRDKDIHVWNTETYEKITTLRGHTQGVGCLTVHNNKLYSGSWAENIRNWNTETYEEISILKKYPECARCFIINENKLYYADETICIWNIETHKGIAILRGHTSSVNCIILHENKLYSGSMDETIRIWNTETYESIAIMTGTHWVNCLTIHENKLYSGGYCVSFNEDSDDTIKTIRVWNIETYEEITNLEGHEEPVKCLIIHDNKLYSGSEDGTIRIWNTETHKEIGRLEGHDCDVESFIVHNNKLYSGGNDNLICVWKV